MHHRLLLASLALALTSLAMAACGIGGDPMPTGYPPLTDSNDPNQPGAPGGTPSDPVDAPLAPKPPVVDATVATTTCAEQIAVTGTAKPGTTVFVVGGAAAAGVSTDTHPQSGAFCLPVTLRLGQNALELRAQDPLAGISEAASLNVQRDDCDATGGGESTQGPTQTPSRNVALGQQVDSKDTPKKGNNGFVVDDKGSTGAIYEGGWGTAAYGGWVRVKLDKIYKLDKLVIRWGSPYGKEYKLLISSMTDPPQPNLDDGLWTVVASRTSGKGGSDTIDLGSTQPLAQHVALWMEQDGNDWTWSETFDLRELEVWDAPEKANALPPAPANVCQ